MLEFTLANYECQNGWYRFGDKCFHVRNEMATFDEFINFCSQIQAKPISIHSTEEQELLKKITQHGNYYWLGGQRSEVDKDLFSWRDRTEFNYQNWNPGEPNQLNETDALCMSANADFNFFWFDDKCDIKRMQICQKSVQLVDNRLSELLNNVTKLIAENNCTETNMVLKRISNIEKQFNKMENKISELHDDIVTIAKQFEDVINMDNKPDTITERSAKGSKDSVNIVKEVSNSDNSVFQNLCNYKN
ncbi:ladderlectin-like protein [Leptotrombidium deliense]|uniref:Ladderlectin-like protein n=1 Tax=Leptotrombidium deliense TaxID=299467 RepID=A0A443S0K9_9ACAR|nr:ladderlectin-like protein [Leptotrombidium deliense]